MTNEEAIEFIEDGMSHHQDIYTGWEVCIEFFDVAKEAIEKQIPMKPKRYPASPKDIVLCPTCGSTFVTRNGFETLMNYCNNCGQKMEAEVW